MLTSALARNKDNTLLFTIGPANLREVFVTYVNLAHASISNLVSKNWKEEAGTAVRKWIAWNLQGSHRGLERTQRASAYAGSDGMRAGAEAVCRFPSTRQEVPDPTLIDTVFWNLTHSISLLWASFLIFPALGPLLYTSVSKCLLLYLIFTSVFTGVPLFFSFSTSLSLLCHAFFQL